MSRADLSTAPCQQNQFLLDHIRMLNDSLQHWTGRSLLDDGQLERDPIAAAQQLYHAPFALLSHGTEPDPIINYANLAAQTLFEMSWQEFIALPSRLSAETAVQQERNALLKRVSDNGYIDDYSGVRIAKTGRRFIIERATVWNLLDKDGNPQGQAAMFAHWKQLNR
ncbi:MEKHLA domain-containing protein [Mariprofundus sp. EBB-1]|uniref:MEKHLA domain-containing protein n=1 Tax=Mariprofundus sp. EBB-1 TaxID=2650971 RepID=UPI000EF17848|nr:MEKHLA domain-containing protein [Mariprofundus sp. EBB-1]RLL52171.1 MEKHLA domain-containing protein [Mariprofundus sp. EBB-1]